MSDQEKDKIQSLIRTLLEKVREFGISTPLFINTVYEAENDWSFVIRLHTIVEASVNERIVTALGDERLFPIIAKLDIAGQSQGKLAFVKALDLLPEGHRSFIKWFAELRNALVHNAKNLDFELKKYFPENMRIHANISSSLRAIFPLLPTVDLLTNEPREALLLGAMAVIVTKREQPRP